MSEYRRRQQPHEHARTSVSRPLRDCPEEEVVTLVQNGNRDAFGELVYRNVHYSRRLAFSMISDVGVVDDVVAESFSKALAHLDQFVARARFSSWLRRIVINECWTL